MLSVWLEGMSHTDPAGLGMIKPEPVTPNARRLSARCGRQAPIHRNQPDESAGGFVSRGYDRPSGDLLRQHAPPRNQKPGYRRVLLVLPPFALRAGASSSSSSSSSSSPLLIGAIAAPAPRGSV